MLECCYNVSGERDKDEYRWQELVSPDRLNRGDVSNLAVDYSGFSVSRILRPFGEGRSTA